MLSKGERLVRDILHEAIIKADFQILPKILYNYRPDWLRWKTNRNLELDIYLPDWKMAIEFNGTQQHFIDAEQRERDAFKKKICTQKGIKFIKIKHPIHLLNVFKGTIISKGLFKRVKKYDKGYKNRVEKRKLINSLVNKEKPKEYLKSII